MAPRPKTTLGRACLAAMLAFLPAAGVAADTAQPVVAKAAAPVLPATVTVQALIDGQVYAAPAGLTLYVNDTNAGDKKASCRAPCLGDWKPLPAPILARRIG